MYLEVLKSLFKLQISPAWAVDAECDSSEPHSCSGCRHAEKWPNNLRGRWAYPFSEFSETQYVYPLIEQSCNSSCGGPRCQGVPASDLGSIDTVPVTLSIYWSGPCPSWGFMWASQSPHVYGCMCLWVLVCVPPLVWSPYSRKPSRHKQNRKFMQMRQ